MGYKYFFVFFCIVISTGVHSTPRKCTINDATESNNDLCSTREVYELIVKGLTCNGICYVGDIIENDNTVNMFVESIGGEVLVTRYTNKSIDFSIPVRFVGNQTYAILMANLHNGMIQAIIKGITDNDKYVSFIDIKQENNRTKVILIGKPNLSDVLLRDEDTVVAVKAEETKIFRSNISADVQEPVWQLIGRNPSKKIINIWIQGNDIRGHYLKHLSIPLFRDPNAIQQKTSSPKEKATPTPEENKSTVPTIKEPLSPEKKEPPSSEEKEPSLPAENKFAVPTVKEPLSPKKKEPLSSEEKEPSLPEEQNPLLSKEEELLSSEEDEPLLIELQPETVTTIAPIIEQAAFCHPVHYVGLSTIIILLIIIFILVAVIIHLVKKNRQSALSSKRNIEESRPLQVNSSLNEK